MTGHSEAENRERTGECAVCAATGYSERYLQLEWEIGPGGVGRWVCRDVLACIRRRLALPAPLPSRCGPDQKEP